MNELASQKEIETALKALKTFNGSFPREAIETAVNLGESLRPHLLTILVETVAAASPTITDDDWQSFTIAIYLLSKLRAQEAFNSFIDVCSLPEEVTDKLFADMVSDGLPKYLASTFNGDFAALNKVALNKALDGYVRSAAITTYLLLFKNKLISRNDLILAFKQFFSDLHQDKSYVVLTSLICDSVTIHGTELLTEIRNAFAGGYVDSSVISLAEAEENLAENPDQVLEAFQADGLYDLIDDPIEEMEWWSFWLENQPKPNPKKIIPEIPVSPEYEPPIKSTTREVAAPAIPHINENRDVGRNDPCPCGSGKKYKKCCLGKADIIATNNAQSHHQSIEAGVYQSINNLMELGYRYPGDSSKACTHWLAAWEFFTTVFTAEMRLPNAIDEVVDGDQFFSNWVFDLSTELVNAAQGDKTYAEKGIKFIKEYLAQFTDEDPTNVCAFTADLAELYCLAGDVTEGERLARSLTEKWPKSSVGYVTMARILEFRPNTDKITTQKAQLEWLEKAKAVPVIDGDDFDLDERIEGVRHSH
jgi:hypothetical protein